MKLVLFIVVLWLGFMTYTFHMLLKPKEIKPQYGVGDCLEQNISEYWESNVIWVVLDVGIKSYRIAPWNDAMNREDERCLLFDQEKNYK